MMHIVYGNELHTIISQEEMKQILCDKYGFPIENIAVSDAEMWCKLNPKEDIHDSK